MLEFEQLMAPDLRLSAAASGLSMLLDHSPTTRTCTKTERGQVRLCMLPGDRKLFTQHPNTTREVGEPMANEF